MKKQEIDEVMEAFGERVTDDLIDTIKDMQNPIAGVAVAMNMRTDPQVQREMDREHDLEKQGWWADLNDDEEAINDLCGIDSCQ